MRTLTRHDPFMVSDRKSISNIAYEDDLHNARASDDSINVENKINSTVETPFTRTLTWKKILADRPLDINSSDKLNLYLFIRHLQFRNIENLRYLEQEAQFIRSNGFPDNYSPEETEIQRQILRSLAGPKGFFLNMASDLNQFMGRWKEASITVLTSKVRLRTSTNPVLTVPRVMGDINIYNFLEPDAFLYWLPLSPSFGVHLTLSKRFCNFATIEMPDNTARSLNRLYLVQMNNSLSVRHCLADDQYIQDDLLWANYKPHDERGDKLRYKRST